VYKELREVGWDRVLKAGSNTSGVRRQE